MVDPLPVSDSKTPAIAIVGMGCRFPGGISSPESFWSFLLEKGDAISDIPAERWQIKSYYDPDRSKPGKIYTRRGGFIRDLDQFDPQYFGISPREAQYLDPQQRLLLEVSAEALADGGLDVRKWAGQPVGVYIGLFMHDYENLNTRLSERDLISPHSATGMSTTLAANRISYAFDFQGPSMVVDTACSSSLVAVHLACQSLINGESVLALAGGVNVTFLPEMYISLCKAGMLSPEGACRSFDAAANGYVRSEGAGIVVLKRLDQALLEGDSIYAVIRGTAVNQDGQSNGLTAPSAASQKKAIQAALQVAQVQPHEISYVEAHGTGTPVGDPIETRALGEAVGQFRPAGQPCLIGSVKSNIGHTESAAGVAGLIKLALMLTHKQIPANLHFHQPNPAIPFEALNLRVPTKTCAWETPSDRPCLAGLNSFGFGGTNAHAILEAPDRYVMPASAKVSAGPGTADSEPTPYLIPVSARSESALAAVKANLAGYLAHNPETCLYDLGATLSLRKTPQACRSLFRAASVTDLIGQLKRDSALPPAGPQAAGKTVFVFSGMGQQWPEMGMRLYHTHAAFRAFLTECDREFQRRNPAFSVLEELKKSGAESRIHETEIAQSAIFCIQAALVQVLRQAGVYPEAVVGHSVGEVAAAYAAGGLSLEQAVRVSVVRSRLQAAAKGQGTMLAVGLSLENAQAYVAAYPDDIALAAYNSPQSLTLAGRKSVLDRIAAACTTAGVFQRFLSVEVPYHSPAMDAILPALRQQLADLNPQNAHLPFYSTVTGQALDSTALTSEYWAENVRQPVLFYPAVQNLIKAGYDCFYEISAHPVLRMALTESLNAEQHALTFTLKRGEDEAAAWVDGLARYYALGGAIRWAEVYNRPYTFIKLPGYPWQKKSCWIESAASRRQRTGFGDPAEAAHPFLAERLKAAQPAWETPLDLHAFAYLRDHQVRGQIVFPAAGFVELFLAAVRAGLNHTDFCLEKIAILAPLLVTENPVTRVQVAFQGHQELVLHAAAGDQWQCYATARYRVGHENVAAILPEQFRQPGPADEAAASVYSRLHQAGLDYGPSFQNVTCVRREEQQITGWIACPLDSAGYQLHPALLDACFQLLAAGSVDGTYLPVSLQSVTVLSDVPAQLIARVQLAEPAPDQITGDILLYHPEGQPVAVIRALTCQYVAGTRQSVQTDHYAHHYHYEWQTDSVSWSPLPLTAAADTLDPVRPEPDSARSAYYREARPLLDQLCLAYIRQAIQTNTIDPRYQQLLARFRVLLEQADAPQSAGRAVNSAVQTTPVERLWQEALRRHPECLYELQLIHRCGQPLGAILAGHIDPLARIFPPEDTVASQLYKYSPIFKSYNQILKTLMTAIQAQVPSGRPLRILEIGAGTGALAHTLLPVLDTCEVDYTFTDISQHFLTRAQKAFRGYPGLTCKKLDIENAPESQGFAPHAYDLILASDVLHATRDLRLALTHVKQLLSASGHLVLLEMTAPPVWIEMVFGLLDGWWAFEDAPLRTASPLLSLSDWHQVLKDNGFVNIRSLTDHDPPEQSEQAVLVAEGPGRLTAVNPPVSDIVRPGVVALMGPPSQLGENLSVRLTQAGHPVFRIQTLVEEASDSVFSDLETYLAETYNANLHIAAPIADTSLQNTDPARTPPVTLVYLAAPASDSRRTPLPLHAEAMAWAFTRFLQRLHTWGQPCRLEVITVGLKSAASEAAVPQAALLGVLRVAANEFPSCPIRCIDFSSTPSAGDLDCYLARFTMREPGAELAVEHQTVLRRRLVPDRPAWQPVLPGAGFEMVRKPDQKGEVMALPRKRPVPLPGQVRLRVRAAGLNFKDVAKVYRILDARQVMTGANLGLECAGVVEEVGAGVTRFQVGDPVMGLAQGAFGTCVCVPEALLLAKPDALSFEAAATLPLALLTAHYALVELGQLSAGERVLIHTATGAVGLAAIQLAQLKGAEILATAGTPEKRDFLHALGIAAVFDSRTPDFEAKITRQFGPKSLDVIINTLPADRLGANLRLLKSVTGRLVDLVNVYHPESIVFDQLSKGLNYHTFDLDYIGTFRPDIIQSQWQSIQVLLAEKQLHPLPYTCYPVSELAAALAEMRASTHIGKLVLEVSDPVVKVAPEIPAMTPDPAAAYLIAGGFSGFGLETALWLAEHGAECLILAGRSALTSEKVQQALARFKPEVRIVPVAVDLAVQSEVESLFAAIRQLGIPLKGIIQSAMVLEDQALDQLSRDQLVNVLRPKVQGTWHLHQASLSHPLDFFICYSSVSTVFGNPGQANYAAANAVVDALCQYRQSQGLPGLALAWGALNDFGILHTHRGLGEFVKANGIRPLSRQHTFASLQQLWPQQGYRAVVDMDFAQVERHLLGVKRSPVFGLLRAQHPPGLISDRAADQENASPDQRADVRVSQRVRQVVCSVLGLADAELSVTATLDSLGFDSLISVEFSDLLYKKTGVTIPKMTLLSAALTVEQLIALVQKEAGEDPESEPGPESPSDPIPAVSQIDAAVQPDPSEMPLPQGEWIHIPHPLPYPKLRLICLPYMGGDATAYAKWIARAHPEIEVGLVQYPGRDLRRHEMPVTELAQLITQLSTALSNLPPAPLVVYGHSLGGRIAVEVARALAHFPHVDLARVIVGATAAPDRCQRLDQQIAACETTADRHVTDAQISELLRQLGLSDNRPELPELYSAMRVDIQIALQLSRQACPPIDCPITALAATRDDLIPDPADIRRWQRFTTSDFEFAVIEGPHLFVHRDFACQAITNLLCKSESPKPDSAVPAVCRYRLPDAMAAISGQFQQLEAAGGQPIYFNVSDGINSHQTRIAGQPLINFSSYNYIGMSGHPTVSAAAQAAISQFGTSVSASRIASGERTIHHELEAEIAAFTGAQSALALVGGYGTNETVISHLFGTGDLILYDSFSHASIQAGANRSGAEVQAFPHNNWQALARMLAEKRSHYRQVLIVIEGVYSMDGDIPDLPEFVRLKTRYDALLMVDEAHSIGVLGQTGRGLCEYHNLPPSDIDLLMGTLSKAFASCGGYIAGHQDLINYLKYTVPGFVFSVGITPPNAAAALASLRLLAADPSPVQQLKANADLFRSLAKAAQLNIGHSHDSAVIPILTGRSDQAAALYHHLRTAGIYALPIVYPAVPENAARLRFFVSSTHTADEIRGTVEAIAKYFNSLDRHPRLQNTGCLFERQE